MTEKNDKQVFGRFLRTKNDQKNRPRDPANDLEDVKQDVSQFLGIGPASQYGNAVSLGKEFASAYEGYEKTIVGHSLGGGLATAASLATEVPAITFNPAAITEKTMSQLSIQNAANANITNYVVTGEPLSYFQNIMGMHLPGNTVYLDAPKTSNIPFVNSLNSYEISTLKKILVK